MQGEQKYQEELEGIRMDFACSTGGMVQARVEESAFSVHRLVFLLVYSYLFLTSNARL